MQPSRSFTTRIDISEQSRQLIGLLNERLADAFDLYSQLKQAHWNVKGSDFIQLHELYDTTPALELADQDTADLFIEVSRAIDKHLWFVEAHLQPQSRLSRRSGRTEAKTA